MDESETCGLGVNERCSTPHGRAFLFLEKLTTIYCRVLSSADRNRNKTLKQRAHDYTISVFHERATF